MMDKESILEIKIQMLFIREIRVVPTAGDRLSIWVLTFVRDDCKL